MHFQAGQDEVALIMAQLITFHLCKWQEETGAPEVRNDAYKVKNAQNHCGESP